MNNMIRKIADNTETDCRSYNISCTGAKFSDQPHRDVDSLLAEFSRSLPSLKRPKVV